MNHPKIEFIYMKLNITVTKSAKCYMDSTLMSINHHKHRAERVTSLHAHHIDIHLRNLLEDQP